MINFKVLIIYLGMIFMMNIIFFALAKLAWIYLVLLVLLAPILAVILAWWSYWIGKKTQMLFTWNLICKIAFSLAIAILVSSSYWIVSDIFNSFVKKQFTLFHTSNYLVTAFCNDFTLNGRMLCYIQFIIVFVFIITGILVQNYYGKNQFQN